MAEEETQTKTQEQAGWQYTPSKETDSAFGMPPAAATPAAGAPSGGQAGSVSWTAAEYIDHDHNFGWYLLLALATATLATGIYFLTKEYFAAGTIVVIGVIVGVFAVRKPRQVTYELTSRGLRVGDKQYDYHLFKSFAVIKDDGHHSLNLFPLKRFMPPVSAYFDPTHEKKIVNTLSDYLPYEERPADRLDRLSRQLKL